MPIKAVVHKGKAYIDLDDAALATKLHGTLGAFQGRRIIKAPDTPTTHRELRRRGILLQKSMDFETPSPYPNIFNHQKKMIKFYLQNYQLCINGGEMGTAKTAPTIWTMMNLKQHGIIERILVVSPKSCVKGVWENGINELYPFAEYSILLGSWQKREEQFALGHDIDLINYHGVKILGSDLLKKGYDLIIIDELDFYSVYKRAKESHYKVMWNFLKKMHRKTAPLIWGMNGNIMTTDPMDVWSMMRVINHSGDLPKRARFKQDTMYQVTQYKWDIKDDFAQHVEKILPPTIIVRKDDVIDLPDTLVTYRHIEATPKQKDMFRKLKKDYVYKMQGGLQFTAANAAVLVNKLLQVSMGMVYDDEGVAASIDFKERTSELITLLRAVQGKAIIFAPYTEMLATLQRAIKAAKLGGVCLIDGGTTPTRRFNFQNEFNDRDSDLRFWLAHPATCSHGLNLTAANVTFWFGPIHSNRVFAQACERNDRPGQEKRMILVKMYSTNFEKKIYEKLERREKMGEVLKEYLLGESL